MTTSVSRNHRGYAAGLVVVWSAVVLATIFHFEDVDTSSRVYLSAWSLVPHVVAIVFMFSTSSRRTLDGVSLGVIVNLAFAFFMMDASFSRDGGGNQFGIGLLGWPFIACLLLGICNALYGLRAERQP